MRPLRPLVVAAAAVTSLGLALPATAAPPAAAAGGLSATHDRPDRRAGRGQARPHEHPEEGRLPPAGRGHPAQRQGRRQRRGPASATGVTTDKQGRTAVDVLGDAKSVAAAIGAVGGRVVATSRRTTSTRASVPLRAVESLAGKAGVHPGRGRLAGDAGPTRAAASPRRRRRSWPPLGKRLSDARTSGKPTATAAQRPTAVNQGSVVSEGDRAHASRHGPDPLPGHRHRRQGRRAVRRRRLAGRLHASGDLPADTGAARARRAPATRAPRCWRSFTTSRRTRSLIRDRVHRASRASPTTSAPCAPPAPTSSSTTSSTSASRRSRTARSAQAVIDVTADGALYFSSAGNEGNVDDGTSGN